MQVLPLEHRRRLHVAELGARSATLHVDTEWKATDRLRRTVVDTSDLGLARAPARDRFVHLAGRVVPSNGPQRDHRDGQHKGDPRPAPASGYRERIGGHPEIRSDGNKLGPIKPAN